MSDPVDPEHANSQQNSLSMLRAILETAADGILIVDHNGAIVDYNEQLFSVLKMPQAVIQTRKVETLLQHVRDHMLLPQELQGEIQEIYTLADIATSDQLKMKDGRVIERSTKPCKINEQTIGRVWCFRDITEQVSFEQRLEYQATHDVLTGLPNRVLLFDKIRRAMHISDELETKFAILFFDLDHFKVVNENYSHAVGDQLLKLITKRLQTTIRSDDVLARVGGDEFILLLADIPMEEVACKVADQFIKLLDEPFVIFGQTLSITTSIGISFYPKDGFDVDDLIRGADKAMHLAKQSGVNQWRIFTENLHKEPFK